MSVISVSGLTFGYDGSSENIFENVSFQLDTAWRLGFVGRNGRGKTTFLRLLMGEFPYTGTISASVDFEYFPYCVPDVTLETLTVISQIAPGTPEWRVRKELSLLEAPEDIYWRPFGTLSPGERTKALLAALFLRENSFLLIDEPTNNLDAEARELVSEYLKGKSGFILVSHDRAFLDGCVDHVLSINRADIEVQRGNFTSWDQNRRLRDQYELSENDRLKKEIKSLQTAARRSAEWSDKAERSKIGFDPREKEKSLNARSYEGEKARKIMSRSKQLEARQLGAAEKKAALLKNIEKTDTLRLSPLEHYAKRLVLLEDVSVAYGNRTVCEGISFTVEQGDRVRLSGRNGSGKSSLIRLICGEDVPHTGRVQLASGLVISMVSQDTSMLSGDLSEYAEKHSIDESLFKAILRKLDFQRTQFDKRMEDFSAGQKKKVLIARSLCERAHLYIWDEPLNYIDVLSRMQIEELLLSSGQTLLFVEHDRAFAEQLATKTVKLGSLRRG